MGPYPKKDFPWTFYFNGVAMPKWGANWPLFAPDNDSNWDWEVGPRDFFIIRNKIDLVGSIESANPHAFLYAVQEVLCILFTERRAVIDRIDNWALKQDGDSPALEDIYHGLVETAFEMRTLAKKECRAFWTSGYDADRLRLIDAMRRAELPSHDKDHQPAPHMVSRARHINSLWKDQIKVLHHAATMKNIPQAMRKRLLEL